MIIRWIRTKQCARYFVGVLVFSFIGIPACFAGGALTIERDKKVYAPRGSVIPEQRVEKVLQKMEERKAEMRSKENRLKEELAPRDISPQPQDPDKK